MKFSPWSSPDASEIVAWIVTAFAVMALVNLLSGSVPLERPRTPDYVRDHRR
jgi:hypothetical protein